MVLNWIIFPDLDSQKWPVASKSVNEQEQYMYILG